MKPVFKTLDYLYFHTAGAGNTAYATVYTQKRAYCVNLAAATANSLQFSQGETIKRIVLSTKCAATGSIEVSRVSTSQIATTLGTQDVIGRVWIEPVTTSGMPQKDIVLEFD